MVKTRPRSPALEVRASECGEGTCLVECAGEIDIGTAPRFRAALDEALRLGTRRVVIDLGGVDFMDSVGVGHIVSASKRARPGARLLVCTDRPHLRMLLEMAGLNGISRLCRSASEALQAR